MRNSSRPALALMVLGSVLAHAQSPSFAPSETFQGSSLDSWHSMGDAKWSASDGEITGTGNGWLVFDKPSQDTGVYLQFKCDGDCNAGILLRAEKTADGMKGILLSIQPQELAAYSVTMNAQGEETGRNKLRIAGGQIRFAPPAPPPGTPARAFRRPELPPMPGGIAVPVDRPKQGLRKDEWNDVEVLLDADIVRAFFNDGGDAVSAATEDMNGYGRLRSK